MNIAPTEKCNEKFRPAGAVLSAHFSATQPQFSSNKLSRQGARRRGQLYEHKVQDMLDAQYGARYLPSPWIRFSNSKEPRRWCQPDGLLFDLDRKRITIMEVKYSHTPLAWWQTFYLYAPVLKSMFPEYTVYCTEIVRWYDPMTVMPGRALLTKVMEHEHTDILGVFIWNPSRQ